MHDKQYNLTLCIQKVIAYGRKIRIAFVGDLITVGVGVDDPFEDSYPIQLNCLLGSSGYEVNSALGISGAAIWRHSPLPYVTTTQYCKAVCWPADVLVVCLGSNDTVNPMTDTFKEQFIEDYCRLLSELQKNSPTVKTFICKIPPIFGEENAIFAEVVPEINDLIDEVANSCGAVLIDLNTPFTSREDLFTDGIHPNEMGARLIAETVYNAISVF